MSKARDEYYKLKVDVFLCSHEGLVPAVENYVSEIEAERAELYKELKRIMDADESEFLDLYFWDNTAELLQKYEGKI